MPHSGLHRLSSVQIQVAGVVLVSLLAVLAAFLKLVIGLEAHKGWDLVGFFQDVAQFAFIAAIVTAVSAGVNVLALRRQHQDLIFRSLSVVLIAFHGPSTTIFRVSPSDTIERQSEFLKTALSIIDQTEETMRQFAGWLYDFIKKYGETEPSAPASRDPMLRAAREQLQAAKDAIEAGVSKLLWNEFHRIMTLSHDHQNLRGQRRILLSYLVDDLAQITSANSELAAGAIAVRERAVEYLALIQQTDAAIESDFVLNSAGSKLWTTNPTAGKTYQVNLAGLSSVSDRVAYLLAYCDERLDNATGSDFKNLVSLLAPSFRALEAEFYAAKDLAKAFRSLTEQALSARTAPVSSVVGAAIRADNLDSI
jgi:hypothetical protein